MANGAPRRRWAMILLCLAAFALRLGPLWANRFHPDEALYASWGLLIRTGRDVWLSRQGVDKSPLLFYLMAVSFHYVWRSEVAARLPGLVAGTLSVPLVFQISNAKYHPSGWIAAALVAFSPFAILFSPTAFLDHVMVMLGLAACAAAVRGRAGWAGVLMGLSAATKLTGLLFLPLAAGLCVQSPHDALRTLRSTGRLAAGVLGIIALVIVWDRVKGGTPFWMQQAINYQGVRLAPLVQVFPRLRAWLSFFPYFFGWPALAVIGGLAAANLKSPIPNRQSPFPNPQSPITNINLPHVLACFALFYVIVHTLFSFELWDRYLLGLVPVIALLAGECFASLASRLAQRGHRLGRIFVEKRLRSSVMCGVCLVILLPPALVAARSGYPIGGDHGAYDGIDQVADYLRALPKGAVAYDYWLGWEFKYYLWDAQVYLAYFPTPDVLRDDLIAFGDASPRYVTIPAFAAARPVLEAIDQAGFQAAPVLTTVNRRGQITFTVYKIESSAAFR